MKRRSSGILLHITSLPSKYGIGDLGPSACKFADFLAHTRQSYWQILPLNPPAIMIPHSPYNPLSAYAGNPLLISPEILYHRGLLTRKEIRDIPASPKARTDFQLIIGHGTNARTMQIPKMMLFNLNFLPRWITNYDIKSGPFS